MARRSAACDGRRIRTAVKLCRALQLYKEGMPNLNLHPHHLENSDEGRSSSSCASASHYISSPVASRLQHPTPPSQSSLLHHSSPSTLSHRARALERDDHAALPGVCALLWICGSVLLCEFISNTAPLSSISPALEVEGDGRTMRRRVNALLNSS